MIIVSKGYDCTQIIYRDDKVYLRPIIKKKSCFVYQFTIIRSTSKADSIDLIAFCLQIEECILECQAWKKESPLWDAIRDNNGVPACEEVQYFIDCGPLKHRHFTFIPCKYV